MWLGLGFKAGLVTRKHALGHWAGYTGDLSNPRLHLAIQSRQKCTLAHRGSGLSDMESGCSRCSHGGGLGLGCDLGSLSAERLRSRASAMQGPVWAKLHVLKTSFPPARSQFCT